MEITFTQLALLIATAIAVSAASVAIVARRRGSGAYLCDDCRFNNEADCQKEERPRAMDCTAYRTAGSAGSGEEAEQGTSQ